MDERLIYNTYSLNDAVNDITEKYNLNNYRISKNVFFIYLDEAFSKRYGKDTLCSLFENAINVRCLFDYSAGSYNVEKENGENDFSIRVTKENNTIYSVFVYFLSADTINEQSLELRGFFDVLCNYLKTRKGEKESKFLSMKATIACEMSNTIQKFISENKNRFPDIIINNINFTGNSTAELYLYHKDNAYSVCIEYMGCFVSVYKNSDEEKELLFKKMVRYVYE